MRALEGVLGAAAAALVVSTLVGCGPESADSDGAREQARAAEARPHILLIVADDLGWNDVGYHDSEIRTPRIDRLAAEGVRSEHFYVLPRCSATRAALLTGRYPLRYRMQASAFAPGSSRGLDLAERTLANTLRDAGYATALVGKWHLGMGLPEQLPLRRGFEHHYGHYGGKIDYFEHTLLGGLDWHRNGEPVREPGYSTDLLATEAERLVASHDPDRPLFLMLSFNAPHEPLQPLPADMPAYAAIANLRRRVYAAMVTRLDHAVGRVVDAFEAAGVRDDTLVLFLSDNGGNPLHGASNHPLSSGKADLAEGGIRVPAVWAWPAVLPAGTIVEAPMHAVDVHATVLEAAGLGESSMPLDGIDLLPVLRGGRAPERDILLTLGRHDSALRSGRWKLRVSGAIDSVEAAALFDVVADPGERTNLAEREPRRTAELLERLRRFEAISPPRRSRTKKPMSEPPVPEVWGAWQAEPPG